MVAEEFIQTWMRCHLRISVPRGVYRTKHSLSLDEIKSFWSGVLIIGVVFNSDCLSCVFLLIGDTIVGRGAFCGNMTIESYSEVGRSVIVDFARTG